MSFRHRLRYPSVELDWPSRACKLSWSMSGGQLEKAMPGRKCHIPRPVTRSARLCAGGLLPSWPSSDTSPRNALLVASERACRLAGRSLLRRWAQDFLPSFQHCMHAVRTNTMRFLREVSERASRSFRDFEVFCNARPAQCEKTVVEASEHCTGHRYHALSARYILSRRRLDLDHLSECEW